MKNTILSTLKFSLVLTLLITQARAGLKEVENLISNQRFQEAGKELAPLVEEAKKKGSGLEYANLLVKKVMLEVGLHGYETGVKELRAADWPKDPLSHAMVGIVYARTLKIYHDAYSWEIRKREKISGGDKFDLKSLTSQEIYEEAYRSYEKAWKMRQKLGELSRDKLSEIIRPNNYPKEIRGTLRDTLTYLLVELLSDAAGWRPEDAADTYLLSLKDLLAGHERVAISAPEAHPLEKIASALRDLENWHLAEGNKDAALEARFQLFRVLQGHFTSAPSKKELMVMLKGLIESKKSVPWVTIGYGLLAEMTKDLTDPDAKIRAIAIARSGAALHPTSPGASRCRDIIREIEQPSFQIEGMNIDGDGRNSFAVSYRNLLKLYFKTVRVDFEEFIKNTKDYSLRPGWRELEGFLKAKPAYTWTSELLETKDYRNHNQFIRPPVHSEGFYVLLASNEPSFETGVIQGIQIFFGSVSFSVAQDFERGEMRVEVVSGKDGGKVSGAEVSLFVTDYQKGHKKLDTVATDGSGQALFKMKPFLGQGSSSYFFIVKHKATVVGSVNPMTMYSYTKTQNERVDSFIYTDRSIFRPEQKVLWKIVAYEGRDKKYKVSSGVDVNVSLRDANFELVQTVKVRTNSFGSASGEFVIPKGRLLGNWTIQTDHGGTASLKVEEYKRPTFLVEMEQKGAELRLNKEARLMGQAKYYFGMPLTAGVARWKVQRRVVLPWWCFWGSWNWGHTQSSTLVASGSAALKQDGSFEVKFTPQADEKISQDLKGVTYSYSLDVDVTDEGGETQGSSLVTTIGFVAVSGTITMDKNFYLDSEEARASISRTDLSGKPLAGKGSWKLVKLVEPKETLVPSDIPAPRELRLLGQKEFKHPDDLRQKRWSASYRPEMYLRDWGEAALVKKGELVFSETGKVDLNLPSIKEGAYRLIFSTKDSFGADFTAEREFLVAAKSSNFHLPGFFAVQKSTAEVGEKIRLFATSGFPGQRMILEVFKRGAVQRRMELFAGKDSALLEFPVTEEDRGGLTYTLRIVRDYQSLQFSTTVMVPYSNKDVEVAFSTMRDKMRPGSKESWAVSIKGKNGRKITYEDFELLTYMYDQSLDAFTGHLPPSPLSIYPVTAGWNFPTSELGPGVVIYTNRNYFPYSREFTGFAPDYVTFYPNYGIGGPGVSGGRGGILMRKQMTMESGPGMNDMAAAPMALDKEDASEERAVPSAPSKSVSSASLAAQAPSTEPVQVRSNFSENGFWKPHLVPGKDGAVKFEFTVPDSVTSWQLWAHAVSKDLQSGRVSRQSRSIKELMVRPYLPRFFREGDEAFIKVVVNNSSQGDLAGNLEFDLLDESQKVSLAKDFGLQKKSYAFEVKAAGSTTVTVKLKVPVGPRVIAVKAVAKSGHISDGEVRPLPVLPGRVHLAQSKFVTLKNQDKKTLTFPDLAKNSDPSLVNDLFVVTLDAQLFYSVLSSLPYLVSFPYQSTDAMMNTFVSTGILSSVFDEFPPVRKMAREFSSRKTMFEKWDADPNRKLAMEEAPWLALSRGGPSADDADLITVLDPDISKNTRNRNLRMLQNAQTSSGGFPWFPGGPPSPYQTLSVLYGFSKAIEFKVEVPKDMTVSAWRYLHEHYVTEIVRDLMAHNVGWEFVTFLNYVLSNYPDPSWSGEVFTESERRAMLDFSFRHWRDHSPYLKAYLTLTLIRSARSEDAKLVWASVMDSAKTTADEGTHWAQEDRTWLWYNDTVETHAMALRVGSELKTPREQLDGLVHWIFLNKKLNHWKSTRATAEVIYALTHFLKKTKQLGVREKIDVKMGGEAYEFEFNPDRYTGKKNQIVIPAEKVSSNLVPVTIEKETKGLAFASATWHYSTEKLPKEAVGDFLKVSRKYYKRSADKKSMNLTPISDGASVEIGDEVEVHISLSSKHPVEYVHLKDPRAAGFEPVDGVSQHKWDLGIYWYEEIRDSATNFFFENLPQGQFTFKYRIRASTSGKFRAGPATLQPLYAPEFVGFSEGHELMIK